MAQPHQVSDDAASRAHPRDSSLKSWIPTLFGSAPSRLLKPPPQPKPLDHIYGLNMDSTTAEHNSITYDAGNGQSVQQSETNSELQVSFHSQTSLTATSPDALCLDRMTGKNTQDTMLYTQVLKIHKTTTQYTRKAGTQLLRKGMFSGKVPLDTRRRDGHRAQNVDFARRQRLRRAARSKMATKSLGKYLKNMDTRPKPTETVSQGKDGSVQSPCSAADDRSEKTTQTNTPWPDRITNSLRLFIYIVGVATLVSLCVGIVVGACKSSKFIATSMR